MERTFTYTIDKTTAGRDIRGFLRSCGYSRHILASIKPLADAVLVNGKHELLRYVLQEGDVLTIRVRDEQASPHILPAPVPFSLVYEDADLLIIDKPADVAIHPAVGHPANTLANGVALYYQQQGIPFVFRCINRLDRDTTGLLIVAKNIVASTLLETALQHHRIRRTYLAVAEGTLNASGTIDLPIGRKEGSLIERCIDSTHGDRALTHYIRVNGLPEEDPFAESPTAVPDAAAFPSGGPTPYTAAAVRLETGRTHQIRVHMAAIGHPLLGDSLYNPAVIPLFEKGVPKPDAVLPYGLERQALHSWKLAFAHPITNKPLHFTAPIPEDMRRFFG